jgi:hypothetical protein
MKLSDLVAFRKERLFQGAVQISWFQTDEARAKAAATSFVFHGPSYHGVAQQDLESGQDHKLTDTASFTRDLLATFKKGARQDNPFTLAIAGYGTGKSHLGLTLATLLSEPTSTSAKTILENIRVTEEVIADEIKRALAREKTPFLVITLNGMEDFDLASKINELLLERLRLLKQDTTPIEELRPRFRAADKFVRKNFQLRKTDFAKKFGKDSTLEGILEMLARADEQAFKSVNQIFEESTGSPIRAVGQESLQELLVTVGANYCGEGKPFSGLVIIFDEFGRYLEFAVERPHIAGSAALQQLFEGIQADSSHLHLLCFIQHELRAYVSRVAQSSRDEINRYIGRFDSAKKVYLSTNLETIFASLIEKKQSAAIQVASASAIVSRESERDLALTRDWFPGWERHALWCDMPRFNKVVKEGCWPLHPVATWLLYRLASVGKSLQQRSAVSFLEDTLSRYESLEIPENQEWSIPAAALCSDALVTELISSETYGQQGAVAHAFVAVRQKYEHNLTAQELQLLRAVLLANKMGLSVKSQGEADQALRVLAGSSLQETRRSLDKLGKDYGVIEWDDRFHRYEILGDAVPRAAFFIWLRDSANQISKDQREKLFTTHGQTWSPGLADVTPTFAEDNCITTKEWIFQATCSCVSLLEQHLQTAFNEWVASFDIDTPRGHVIYCYVGPDDDKKKIEQSSQQILQDLVASHRPKLTCVPLLIVLLHDDSGEIGNAIAELSVLKNAAGNQDAAQFRNFIPDYETELKEELQNEISDCIAKRHYICASNVKIEPNRLLKFTSGLFTATYPHVLSFPFDGFKSAQGNGSKDCRTLIITLFQGSFSHDWVQAQPAQMQNRAKSVLYDQGWGVIGENGQIRLLPANSTAALIFNLLQTTLETDGGLNLGTELQKICSPPYGCNLASAGLLLGVFIAGRKDKLAFSFNNGDISASNWISQAFGKGYFLNLEVLGKTHIRLIAQSESDAWEKLLAEWEVSRTHASKIIFSRQAASLRQSVKVPGFLFDRYQLLEHRATDAKEALERVETRRTRLQNDFDEAYERQNAGNLSRYAAEFKRLHREMISEQETWTPEQIARVEPMIEQCRQATIQFFPRWLDKQDVLDVHKMGDFKHHLSLVKKNLQEVDLLPQIQALDAHVNRILANVEERIRLGNIANEAREFLKVNGLSANLGVAQLTQRVERAKPIIASLSDAHARVRSGELAELRTSVEKLKTGAEALLKAHKTRAEALWNSEIQNLETIGHLLAELRGLMSIFDGCGSDLSDFASLTRWLERFAQDANQLSNTALAPPEFAKMVKKLTKEATTAKTDDDEIPWEIDQVYSVLAKSIQASRQRAADEWITQFIPTKTEISRLDAKATLKLKSLLQNPPAVLSEAQLKKADESAAVCDERLDFLEVDGLLARFEALSDAAKRDFIRKAEKLLKK